jgi:serine/threonine-protein kinase
MKIINHSPIAPSQVVPGLPPRLDDVIEKGLRKDKTKRYGQASELASALCDAFGLEPNAEKWAAATPSALEQALAQAKPPPAKAFGAVSNPPPAQAAQVSAKPAAPAPSASAPSRPSAVDSDSLMPQVPTKNGGVMIGMAVGALALVGVVVALLMR